MEWATMGYENNVTVLMPTGQGERVGSGVEVKKGRLAPATLDVFFARAPINCPSEMCEVLKGIFEYRQPHNVKTAGSYKYILDVRSCFLSF